MGPRRLDGVARAGATGFGILGPLQVTVRGARRVALLIRLLMSANQLVPAERLAHDIWGETPSAGGAPALQNLVSLLRNQIGTELLATRSCGYVLTVGPGELDAADFESDVSAGRDALGHGDTHQGVELFERALGWWRGPPLVEVDGASWARSEIARLGELRLGAQEALLDARLALGQHREVMSMVEAAVDEHPLREQRWGTLLLALYRCGRQAEALRSYQRLRALLSDELGIEPCARLEALEEAIVLQKPELDWRAAQPIGPSSVVEVGPTRDDRLGKTSGDVPLPSRLEIVPTFGLIGRAAESASLVEAFARVSGGGGREVALLSGEAGIGKTILAAQLAHLAYDAGACVLFGRCEEDVGAPYRPFVELLNHYVAHADEHLLRAHVESHGGELSRLVPALRDRLVQLPDPQSTDAETVRYLLYQAVVGLLAEVSSTHPVVVLLDDLQWADKPSLQLLRHLVASAVPMRLMVVGTYRELELSGSHPLTETLVALQRERGINDIALAGLDIAEVLAFIEATGHSIGDERVRLARALHDETDGNPFFVGEMLRHLTETGAIARNDGGRSVPTAQLTQDELPRSVRQVIGWRVARLGAEAGRVLSAAAIVGQEFDLELVARMVELDEEVVLGVFDAATAAALITEVRGGSGHFRFVHALIQHTLYADLGGTRQARSHRRAADVLEAISGDEPGDRTADLARHWKAAGTAGSAKAATYARLAGDRALAALAPTEAIRWYDIALGALDLVPDDLQRARTLAGLGEAQNQAGEPAHRETLLEAGRLAQRIGDVHTLVRAALNNHRYFQSVIGTVDLERVAVIEAALEALGPKDSASRALLLVLLALERANYGDYPARRASAREALAIARRLGDPVTVLEVMMAHRSIVMEYTTDELYEENLEIKELATVVTDLRLKFLAALRCGCTSLHLGDAPAVRRHTDNAVQLASMVGHPMLKRTAALHKGWAVLLAGYPDRAESLAMQALQIGIDHGQPDALTIYGGQLLYVRWHQGRMGELVETLAQLAVENPGIPGFRGALALAYTEADRDDEARSLLDRERSSGFSVPECWLQQTYLAQWAEVATHLDDRPAAEALSMQLERWPARVIFTGGTVHGATAHLLGALATVLGRFGAAEAHFAQALDMHERLASPFFIARTRSAWARMLETRGDPGDLDRAGEMRRIAHDLSATYGFAMVDRRSTTPFSRV